MACWRCHQLAILADGKLVAQGAPQQLMADIPATVVEVDAGDTVAARQALLADSAVLSIAQLGTRLHVLLDRATADPEARIAERMTAAGVTGQSRLVAASLEDVFVSATGFSRSQHIGAGG